LKENKTVMKVSNRSKQVAQTIQEQLMAGGMEKVMSWGVSEWRVGELEDKRPFLAMNVNGLLHQGETRIILEWSDTYTVQNMEQGKVIKEQQDVYFDEVTDVVDSFVEYPGSDEEYRDAVNKVFNNEY
jgi:hypothetical protein